jgi:inorganic pyrophosphatase
MDIFVHMTTDIEQLEAIVGPGIVNAVIEIPAGTVDKRQYDPATNTFPIDHRTSVPRHALDVFVLCASAPSGTVMEVEPIGIIELIDAGERDDKVVAVPADRSLLNMDVDDIQELPQAVRDILVTWLLNYDPVDNAQLVAVKGRDAAWAAVQRWAIR